MTEILKSRQNIDNMYIGPPPINTPTVKVASTFRIGSNILLLAEEKFKIAKGKKIVASRNICNFCSLAGQPELESIHSIGVLNLPSSFEFETSETRYS
jgi:hypothetical protein